jgi:hypothetical protein
LNPEHEKAIRYIVALTPIICSALACLFTYIGRKLYADRMARLTVGVSHKSMRDAVKEIQDELN